MNKMLIPILFALGTALFWGCYGPTIGNAQAPKIDGRPLWSPFKPYVFIGIAYLVIAVAGGLWMMKVKGDSFNFFASEGGTSHFATVKWGFLAGVLGAFGALCLTTAMMTSKGNALLVMPIVFGGAVSVSALVSVWKLRLAAAAQDHAPPTISNWLLAGMAFTVIGIIMVAANTPHGHAAAPKTDHGAAEESAGNDTASEGTHSDTSSETVSTAEEETSEGEEK